MLDLLLLFAAQAASPPAPSDDTIVVVGKRLQSISVSVGQDAQGSWHCSLDRSTGRPKLDDRLCRGVTSCVRKGAQTDSAIRDCIGTTKKRLLRQLERQRERAR